METENIFPKQGKTRLQGKRRLRKMIEEYPLKSDFTLNNNENELNANITKPKDDNVQMTVEIPIIAAVLDDKPLNNEPTISNEENSLKIDSLLNGFSFKKRPRNSVSSSEYSKQEDKMQPPEIKESPLKLTYHSMSIPSMNNNNNNKESFVESFKKENSVNFETKENKKIIKGFESTIKKSQKKKTIGKRIKTEKDRIREKLLETNADYLFNFLKDPSKKVINKLSLRDCFHGLKIYDIDEDQVNRMLCYAKYGELREDIINTDLAIGYEELKKIIEECNLKFDADNKIIQKYTKH